MPITSYFLPVDRIILVAFDGAQGLDVFGPAEVFAAARAGQRPRYQVVLAAVGPGPLRATSGVTLGACRLSSLRPRRRDTVLVVGGDEPAIAAAVSSRALAAWLRGAAGVVRRIGSVCSGAFILAAAGLLDGKRVATHWSACARLAAFRPAATIDADAIFVRDGRLWTSAGVTTGIDMALAMVEADCGRPLADAIAARLVLYARRPGFQSQWSEALLTQTAASDPLAPVVEWVRANLRAPLDVPRLARRAGLSLRSLHRRCREHLGVTPGKLVERLRVEQARTLLSTTRLELKTIAARCGFRSPASLRRAFATTLGVAPLDFRLVSGASGRPPTDGEGQRRERAARGRVVSTRAPRAMPSAAAASRRATARITRQNRGSDTR